MKDKEIIQSITAGYVTVRNNGCEEDFEGYEIKTNKRTLQLLIDNYLQCCENWGYISTPDDTSHFIGAELYRWNDAASDQAIDDLDDKFEGNAQFITLFTSKGELTFAVYNEHNGYYSHGAVVIEDGKVKISSNL